MARDLSLAEGIGSDSDYINGNLVDGQTKINEFINQDIVQFFQGLMDQASITASGDPDNDTNGYQFIDALVSKIRDSVVVYRGNASDVDFELSDLTLDAGEYNLDLSSIIPSGAKYALLHIDSTTETNAVGDGGLVSFYKDASSGENRSTVGDRCSNTSVPGLAYADIWVSLQTARLIRYSGAEFGSGFATFNITVGGWLF